MTDDLLRPDGRNVRAASTRDAFVSATRQLMEAGTLRPSAAEIAKISQRSVRTLFQHYPSLDDLYSEALDDEVLAERIVKAVLSRGNICDQARAIICREGDRWPSAPP